ncbi:hypothetical protein [Levilactobacillus andaensis]|uniref:hypothetical protein n=1 Tax=Levilactobacillus andaensis TaxID=2799570 RepID=UPI001945AF2A|nr:hypothetical protein [Levilactobacillus andaensis]
MGQYQQLETVKWQCSLTGKLEEFSIIKIVEMVNVLGRNVKAAHIYWVPVTGNLSCDDDYLEPLDNPDYNLQQDFRAYRQKLGLLTPEQVHQIRQNYKLNQEQYALVLGMDCQQLVDIENGLRLQSDQQESLFRLSQDEVIFEQLAKSKRPVLATDQYQSVQKILNDIGKP